MKQKIRVVKFRVNEEQFALIERKAGKFATRTAAILHAIDTMDDTTRREKLNALTEMTALYKQYNSSSHGWAETSTKWSSEQMNWPLVRNSPCRSSIMYSTHR